MSDRVVQQQEVADVLRKLAELQHAVATLRKRFGEPDEFRDIGLDAPLAALALVHLLTVEDALEAVRKRLMGGAELVTSVTT